jgi:cytochrome c556|tara:strand:- start:1714 stop:2232 length:519 start_codon:yes stop_codon:yes gene_type:complete
MNSTLILSKQGSKENMKMINIAKNIGTMMIALGMLFSALNANAHTGATGVVKQRMDAMSGMADAMKSMASVVKGKKAFDPAVFIDNGEVILWHSETLTTLFPEKSIQGDSEALPAIWQNWDDFVKINERTKSDAKKLVEMAQQGSKLRPLTKQFVKLSGGCKACHKGYRKKK